jgi:hypothetical protein
VLDILVRLECKRLAVRKKVLRTLRQTDNSYLAIGGILFIIAAITITLLPGAFPPLTIATGLLLVMGGVFLLTIVLIPVGLFLL